MWKICQERQILLSLLERDTYKEEKQEMATIYDLDRWLTLATWRGEAIEFLLSSMNSFLHEDDSISNLELAYMTVSSASTKYGLSELSPCEWVNDGADVKTSCGHSLSRIGMLFSNHINFCPYCGLKVDISENIVL